MLNRFLNFDNLIGTTLIKVLYFIGLAGIAIGAVIRVFAGLGSMRYSFAMGLGSVLMALIGSVIALLFWRFICELYILFFRISEDVRILRDKT
jgi:uncharacterized protein HemY